MLFLLLRGICLNTMKSVGMSILIQSAFVGLDYRVGMLSSDVLELYMLDGKLGFGIIQILEMIGIIAGKNLWNKDKLLPF